MRTIAACLAALILTSAAASEPLFPSSVIDVSLSLLIDEHEASPLTDPATWRLVPLNVEVDVIAAAAPIATGTVTAGGGASWLEPAPVLPVLDEAGAAARLEALIDAAAAIEIVANARTLASPEKRVELYFPQNDLVGADQGWSIGPSLGFGFASRVHDRNSPDVLASDRPLMLISAGLMLEFPLDRTHATSAASRFERAARVGVRKSRLGVEFGYAQPFVAEEGLVELNDGDVYVGVSLRVVF